MTRVVITGQGTINALGHNTTETIKAFSEGKCGIGALDLFDSARLNVKIGAQVKGYDPKAYFDAKQLSFLDRFAQFALIAADEAILQSGLCFHDGLAARTGVILGTAGGGMQTQDESYRKVYQAGQNRVNPFVVPRLMNSAAVSQIAMRYNLMGPSFTVATACASSNHAMGQAFLMLRTGLCSVVITGGAESMLCFGGMKAWEGLRVMSQDGCRPFCGTRNGMVQGEGAAVFVFETYAHAKARGADILAEVAGFSMSADAHDIVMPSLEGLKRAICAALQDARLNPDEINYINAHGTATAANDRCEAQAIHSVFGAHARKLMVSSTKSMHGHLIGGAGAVELIAVIAALRDGIIAPTINFSEPDPQCDLDIVPNQARQQKARAVLSNAFAFGGLNACIVLKAVA